MTQDTIESFCRLITLYGRAITQTGTDLPEGIEEEVRKDPRRACERLNDLALSCGAIDDQLDRTLASVYVSMDAADARTTPGSYGQDKLSNALARSRRPRREATPAKPVQQEAPAEKAANASATGTEAARTATEGEAGATPPVEATATAAPAKAMATTPQTTSKPRRRRTKSADASQSKPATEPLAATPADESAPADEPTPEAQPAAPATESVSAAPEPTPKPTAPATESAPAATPEPEATPALEPTGAQDRADYLLTVDQSAAIIGCSKQKVYKLIKDGTLPAKKINGMWRLSADAVTSLAAANK